MPTEVLDLQGRSQDFRRGGGAERRGGVPRGGGGAERRGGGAEIPQRS